MAMYMKNPWSGKSMKVALHTSRYVDGERLYLGIDCYDSEEYWEPWSDLTVNLPEEPISGDNCGFVDTNNNPGIEQFIQDYGFGKPTGYIACSGYCQYPEYRFDMERINTLTMATLRGEQ